MFGKVKRLKEKIAELEHDVNLYKSMWNREKTHTRNAIKYACRNCPIYNQYGGMNALKCDAIGCQIFSEVILLQEDEQ
jgi:hypothetical protein